MKKSGSSEGSLSKGISGDDNPLNLTMEIR